jgi:methylated-DNA-[protein]-cysteine S-methyltransferase
MAEPGVTIYLSTLPTPLGSIVAAAHEGAVCALEFESEWPRAELRLIRTRQPVRLVWGCDPCRTGEHVRAYFDGELNAFDRLPVDPRGTPFELRVWRQLRTVPPGETMTYRDLALRVGCPSGYRAVGAANGRNPLAIIVPCHRVVGMKGDLRGYAGGLERKRWLLSHEARHSKMRN